MSGRRIDDHSFWAGRKSEASVFPKGVHTKHVANVEGAGSIGSYEDTEEKIRSVQAKNIAKIKAHGMKEGYRH